MRFIYLFIYAFTYLCIHYLFIDNPHIQLRFPQITLALSYRPYRVIGAALSARLSPAINKHSLYCDITSSLNIQATNFESSRKTAL